MGFFYKSLLNAETDETEQTVSKGLRSTEVEINDFSKAHDEKALLLKYLCLYPEATASALLCLVVFEA